MTEYAERCRDYLNRTGMKIKDIIRYTNSCSLLPRIPNVNHKYYLESTVDDDGIVVLAHRYHFMGIIDTKWVYMFEGYGYLSVHYDEVQYCEKKNCLCEGVLPRAMKLKRFVDIWNNPKCSFRIDTRLCKEFKPVHLHMEWD